MAILISHALIINKKGEFLVLRRTPQDRVLSTFWDLPGGTVWLKEDPEKGAIRETKEESNLKITNLKLLTHTSNWDKAKKEKFVTLIFTTKNYSGRIKLNHNDHDEYGWFSKSELKKLKTVHYFAKILKLI